MRIALAYTLEEEKDVKRNQHGLSQMNRTTEDIARCLKAKGHEVHTLPADKHLLAKVIDIDPECIFNNCTGIEDKKSQPQVAGLLELANIPFTGSSQLTHNLALYKPLTKLVLQAEGIPTPRFQVFRSQNEKLDPTLRFPLIVKPEHEGSSMGITKDSVVSNEEQCLAVVSKIVTDYQQPALVEEFINGREFTVGVLGNDNPIVLPLIEIGFPEDEGFYSHQIKAGDQINTLCPAVVEADLKDKIEGIVLQAYAALSCRDYARVDVRVDDNNKPYIIEVNTLPGLQKGYSDFPKAANEYGIDFSCLIETIINLAIDSNS